MSSFPETILTLPLIHLHFLQRPLRLRHLLFHRKMKERSWSPHDWNFEVDWDDWRMKENRHRVDDVHDSGHRSEKEMVKDFVEFVHGCCFHDCLGHPCFPECHRSWRNVQVVETVFPTSSVIGKHEHWDWERKLLKLTFSSEEEVGDGRVKGLTALGWLGNLEKRCLVGSALAPGRADKDMECKNGYKSGFKYGWWCDDGKDILGLEIESLLSILTQRAKRMFLLSIRKMLTLKRAVELSALQQEDDNNKSLPQYFWRC